MNPNRVCSVLLAVVSVGAVTLVCPSTRYVLTTITLRGRVVARRTLGSGGCDTDGFYDGDSFGQLAWQPQ